ncbi:pentraxin-related protein PTX3-like [Rana temporaria]|uniref:pentraxin-related protein PTX3-like n=1 Tax=Rana temporaria TaxID=8407 RepID=UPI001AAD13EF|nr:pentraxin-related protein PTX3-like [Rana temporaria]
MMKPLQIFICAILCLPSALTIAVDVQDLDNQILVTGEVTLPDCKQKEHTRWDKMMTMLENSHMRQNMLLQYFEEFKVELQVVKNELWELEAKTSVSCSNCLKSITTDFSSLLDSKCQPQNNLNNVEESIAVNQDIADRLQRIENLLKKREEADENKVEPAEEADQNKVEPTEEADQNKVEPTEDADQNKVEPTEEADQNKVEPTEEAQDDSIFAQMLDPVDQDLLETESQPEWIKIKKW